MKKIILLITSIILCMILFTGCSSAIKEDKNNESNKIKVISTIFPGYDFTKAIGKDNVDVSMLMPPGSETHSFEPSPQDIINIQNCDLFIYTGSESDTWVEKIIDSLDTEINTLKMMDSVTPLESDDDHNHKDNEEHDHHDENHDDDNHSDEHHSEDIEYDEHIWTSPKNAIKICQSIEQALISIDEQNSNIYEENLNSYIKELEKLDNEFSEFFTTVENKTLVFGDRFPFKYFAKEYNLKYYSAYTGCSTEVEPSVSTIASLIDLVKENNISTIYYIELSNHKVADSIAESTGAKTALLHSCHNVSKEEFANNATYLSLMENNLVTLREAMR